MLSFPGSLELTTSCILCILVIYLLRVGTVSIVRRRHLAALPVPDTGDVDPKQAFVTNGRDVLRKALQAHVGAFAIQTSNGIRAVIRHSLAEEYTKSRSISGVETLRVDGFADYPGFQAAKVAIDSPLLRNMLVRRLSPSLATVRNDMRDELNLASHDILGQSRDWTHTVVQRTVGALAARLVSRVLVGMPLCHDERWVRATEEYTRLNFAAASDLRQVRSFLRPIKHWWLSSCVELRRTAQVARLLIADELSRRETMDNESREKSKPPTVRADCLQWLLEESRSLKVSPDIAAAQLHLSLIGVQTVTHSLGQALRLLCEHPEWISKLRQEAARTLQRHSGWTKAAIYELKYHDSFLKESQRLTSGYLALNSIVTHDMVFSDGTSLPRGTRCFLEAGLLNEDHYSEPYSFDPTRFYSAKGDNQSRSAAPKSNYSSATVEHLGFGFGPRACPGRFWASDLMKMALAHLVLHYDWQLEPEDDSLPLIEIESIQLIHPEARLRVRLAMPVQM
ncbi:hypothetical protein BST61_g3907 [Cercospora zeina]